MKYCRSCGLEKDPSLFYASNGTECKECVKARTKRNRKEKEEYYKEYDRNRQNHEERVAKGAERVKNMRVQDTDFKLRIDGTKAAWAERNKHKRKAQSVVNNAKRDGKITALGFCEHCGSSEKKVQAHHWSYEPEHWLDVIWLCTSCHGKEHKRLNELGRDPDKSNLT